MLQLPQGKDFSSSRDIWYEEVRLLMKKLKTDYSTADIGQIETRIEAFIEML